MENRTSPFTSEADSGQNVGAPQPGRTKTPRLRSPRRRINRAALPAPVGPPAVVLVRRLRAHRDEWLDDNEVGVLSYRTIQGRRDTTNRLFDWLNEQGNVECGTPQLRQFFATQINLQTGEPLSVNTLDTYRRIFTALLNWMKRNNLVSQNAMDGIPPIPAGKKKSNQQVQPFGEEQWRALLAATAKSPFPRRGCRARASAARYRDARG